MWHNLAYLCHLALLMTVMVCAGCGQPQAVDFRLITPQATINTMLGAYGVADLPQAEIDRRLELGRHFHLNDPATLRACFADWDSPSDEGLAGYVFGNVLLAKDELVATIHDERAEIMVHDPERRSRPVVLEHSDIGWRIVLRQSVPPTIQAHLRSKWEEMH